MVKRISFLINHRRLGREVDFNAICLLIGLIYSTSFDCYARVNAGTPSFLVDLRLPRFVRVDVLIDVISLLSFLSTLYKVYSLY
jgi:hypothetical protein